MCYREDSGTLFTLGARDSCVYQWEANYRYIYVLTAVFCYRAYN